MTNERPMSPEHAQLCRFYDVLTIDGLIDAMVLHIDRLQSKLRRYEPPQAAYQSARKA